MRRMARAHRRAGRRIALVPTMGALHEGHLGLVRLARRHADVVVMSIYVNPTQFGPKEDFSRYPRTPERDRALAHAAGVDVVFLPENLYASDSSTVVEERQLSRGRCGARREGHFTGVATVVAKLFLITEPDVAIFGQKDAQQCDVIERMVRDLNFAVRVVRSPTLRDARGLALSSRNRYLTPGEYAQAVAFPEALKQAASKARSARDAEARARRLIGSAPGLVLEYAEWVGGRLCAAVRCGRTRLIDNVDCPVDR
jgi:pantoate--beta-alanine ligase